MTLAIAGAAWLGGLLLSSRLSFPVTAWLVAGAIPAGGLLLWRRHALLWFCAVAFLLGGARSAWGQDRGEPSALLLSLADQSIEVRGTVKDEPEPSDAILRVTLADWSVRRGDAWLEQPGKALLYVPVYDEHRRGDVLVARGSWELPDSADRSAPSRASLQRRDIRAVFYRPTVQTICHTRGPWPIQTVDALRGRLRRSVERILPAPQASLLNGLLIGARSSASRTLLDAFSRTNTLHVVVVSGYNVSLVIAAASWPLRRLRRGRGLYLSIPAVVLYVLLCGASPPVLRAALMGGVALLGQAIGRPRHGLASLAFVTLILTAISPTLPFDLSFQLSFLATLGLLTLSSPIGQRLDALVALVLRRRSDSQREAAGRTRVCGAIVLDALSSTLAAEAFTVPLLLYHFRQFSLVSPLANVLILPAVPLAMALGAPAVLGGLVAQPMGWALGLLAYLPLSYIISIVQLLARVPVVPLPAIPASWVWGYYVLLAALLLRGALVAPAAGSAARWFRVSRGSTFLALTALACGSAMVWASVLWER